MYFQKLDFWNFEIWSFWILQIWKIRILHIWEFQKFEHLTSENLLENFARLEICLLWMENH